MPPDFQECMEPEPTVSSSTGLRFAALLRQRRIRALNTPIKPPLNSRPFRRCSRAWNPPRDRVLCCDPLIQDFRKHSLCDSGCVASFLSHRFSFPLPDGRRLTNGSSWDCLLSPVVSGFMTSLITTPTLVTSLQFLRT